jgi:uncharacterized membrane protein
MTLEQRNLIMPAGADKGLAQILAMAEIALSLLFFAAAVSYARATQARGNS